MPDAMLQKVILIRNVGRFRHVAFRGDAAFGRYTLICAENGRGKSTLCAILRSLLTNSPSLIRGRKTLGSLEAPEVQLLVSNANKTFRDGTWNDSYPHIAIFDSTFVTENVCAGDVVDTEHRRNLYRVIIGAAGVTLAARVKDLDDQIRTKNTEIKQASARVERHAPSGITLDAFIALPKNDGIDTSITAKEQELHAVRQAAQLREKSGLSAITSPVLPAAFAQHLARTFTSLAADAERRVVEQLQRHAMQAHGELWLTEGLRYVANDTCPFCGQPLSTVSLIRDYKNFFSEEYRALINETTEIAKQVNATLGERVAAAIQQALLQNASTSDFWRAYCDFAPPSPSDPATVAEILRNLESAAQALLRIKAAAPLASVPLDDCFLEAQQAFDGLRSSIAVYNAAVGSVNTVIETKKRSIQAVTVQAVEGQLTRLKAQKSRHTGQVNTLCADFARLRQEKSALEKQKAQAREQLDLHTQQVISGYGESINRFLELINAGFRISPPTHNYRGGTPSTSYQIIINEHAVDIGDPSTPLDLPSFKNTLSGGDKSTLALAFFLAQLSCDPGTPQKTVVFDDPFSSLDSFRRNHTAYQIHKCGERCAQAIVLSHEPAFLKLLWDRCPRAATKCLRLARIGEDKTTIAEWDIEKAVQARYHAELSALSAFHSLGEGDPHAVVQKLRPVLETFCRTLYPSQFADNEMLGAIVGKVRTAGASQPLHSVVEHLDEINLYCRRYHHGDNPSAAAEVLDSAELVSYVRRTLKLVGNLT
jgi:wobble nucleotide-excising tRNase